MNWFEFTLLFAVTGSSLVLALRAITSDTNPFVFMTIVTMFATILMTVYCTFKGTSLQLPGKTIGLACLAGCSVALLDMGFIFMFRKGAPVSVAMPIFRVVGLMIAAVIGYGFFKEQITPLKLIGILLACVAVYLLSSKPSEVVS